MLQWKGGGGRVPALGLTVRPDCAGTAGGTGGRDGTGGLRDTSSDTGSRSSQAGALCQHAHTQHYGTSYWLTIYVTSG